MKIPINISFKDIPRSDALERLILTKVDKLEKVCNYITSCRVSVEKTQKHHKTGNPIQICIDLHIPPGHEIVVKHTSNTEKGKDIVSTMIRDAFYATQRKLQKIIEIQHGTIKSTTQNLISIQEAEIEPDSIQAAEI
jgi:ribosome-associated translation inhibitor RaiA